MLSLKVVAEGPLLSEGVGIVEPCPVDRVASADASSSSEPEDAAEESSSRLVAGEVVREEVLGKYVVCLRRNGSQRILHRVGSCYRLPGRDYSNFEVLGEEHPLPEKYKCMCGDCWKQPASCSQAQPCEPSSSSSVASSASSASSERSD